MLPDTVYIYTDASFSPTNKLAIIGHFSIFDNEKKEFSKSPNIQFTIEPIKETNNIRAEIRSALNAIKNAPKALNVVLYTDCEAICNLPSRRENLEKTSFISKSKFIPLKNTDLYKEFFEMMDKVQPKLVWVKGHSKERGSDPIQYNFAFLDQKVRKQLRKIVS